MSLTGYVISTLLILLPLFLLLRPYRKDEPLPLSSRISAIRFYRSQLQDLDLDRKTGKLSTQEHACAELEIQRRILAVDALAECRLTPRGSHKASVAFLLCLLPSLGFGLYLVKGRPSLPPQPQPRKSTAPFLTPEMQALFNKLEQQVSSLQPKDRDYLPQSILLGQVNETMNRPDEALHVYRQALAAHFLPELAIKIAELQTRHEGHISHESLALYRKALDAAPSGAPWRLAIEARIAEGERQYRR